MIFNCSSCVNQCVVDCFLLSLLWGPKLQFLCLTHFRFVFFCTCSMSIKVVFHHGGLFVRDWVITYKGGKESMVDIDNDKWSYFELRGYVKDIWKEFKYEKGFRMWWIVEEDVDFKLVRVDEDADAIKEYATLKQKRLMYTLSMMLLTVMVVWFFSPNI